MDLPEHLPIEQARSYRPLPAVLGTDGEWEGGAILREITSPTGLLLFRTLRDVMLWLMLPPSGRREAFSGTAQKLRRLHVEYRDVPQELQEPVGKLVEACYHEAAQEEICVACLIVAEWARDNGTREAELGFRQAAALARASDSALSLATAKLARDLSHLRRAETWFRRAIKVARLSKDWDTYIRAYLGLGLMYSRAGNGPAARAVMERALIAARRWRLRPLAGEAHHEIFHLWADLGDLRRAYEHAKSARTCYGDAHPLLIRLAADLGVLSVKVGAPARAIPLFQSLLPRMPDPADTTMLHAYLARAAAESHNRSLYEAMRQDFDRSVCETRNLWRTAECHAIIARADLAMCEWDRAREQAAITLRLAEQISYREYQVEAETILEAIASATTSTGQRMNTLPSETPGVARIANDLADELCHAVTC